MKINSEYHTISGKNIVESNPEYMGYREKWRKYPKEYRVAGFPLFLDVDITDMCNLRCPFCLRVSNPELIQNKKMSFDMFQKIIDEGSMNGLYGVKLNIIGEPLLHPDVCKFVRYAKEKGLIDVYFNTNAVLLNEKTANSLIDAKLDRLSISFEGYTKDVYERYRVGSDFDLVVNNIKAIQEFKKERHVNYPKIRIQTVLLPELKSDIESYIEFWKDKADEVGFLDYQPRVEKRSELISDWSCCQLWQRMGILIDGTIISCCHDERKLMQLGNITDVSIHDAWLSKKIHEMRELHKAGKSHLIESCKDCYLRESEIMKRKEK